MDDTRNENSPDNDRWRGCSIDNGKGWRRDPESNRTRRICNPLHNRFAIAPRVESTFLVSQNSRKKGKLEASLLKTGAGKESRTLDLNLGKVALYQLSYSRV